MLSNQALSQLEEARKLIQSGRSLPIKRISQTRGIHRVTVDGTIHYLEYNRRTKKLIQAEEVSLFKVGDRVEFRWYGRKYFGQVIGLVSKGKSPYKVCDRMGVQERYDWLQRATPRGQVSYLVVAKIGLDSRLYWPQVSSMRKG